jgi:transcriptional regulator with GAF, ATPase, and Fis domain
VVEDALEASGGSVKGAARVLGATLTRWMEKYEINRKVETLP